jgi:hypothetical protein
MLDAGIAAWYAIIQQVPRHPSVERCSPPVLECYCCWEVGGRRTNRRSVLGRPVALGARSRFAGPSQSLNSFVRPPIRTATRSLNRTGPTHMAGKRMTAAKWLEESDPGVLVRFLKGKGSERKLRLFAVALHRESNRLQPRFDVPKSRLAADTAEMLAEGGGRVDDATRYERGGYFVLNPSGFGAASRLAANSDVPDTFRASVLRCIFGNPFRRVAVDQTWLSATVVALAQGVYEERAFDRLPILADALQDAGCTDEDVLAHCRSPEPHARGCWVVDLVLAKE